jgi:hypothetical protein
MLTRKTITKARENATLTGRSRLIVQGEHGTFDVEDAPGARDRLRRNGRTVLASVSWDGAVETEKRGSRGSKKGEKKRKKD